MVSMCKIVFELVLVPKMNEAKVVNCMFAVSSWICCGSGE